MKRLFTGLTGCILLSMLAPFSFSSESTSFQPRPKTERRATPGPLVQPETPPRWEPGPLTAAESCEQLESWVIDAIVQRLLRYRYARYYYPSGLNCQATDYPPVNFHCIGADERPKIQFEKDGIEALDIIKQGEDHISVVHDGGFSVLSHPTADSLSLLSTIRPNGWQHGLLAWKDHLVVFSWFYRWARIEIYDVRSADSPTLLRRLDFPRATLVDARLIDGHVFVVLEDDDVSTEALHLLDSEDISLPELSNEASDEEFIAVLEHAREILTPHVQQIVEDRGVESYLPLVDDQIGKDGEPISKPLMACTEALVPADYPAFGIQSVVHLNLTAEEIDTTELSATGVFGAPWLVNFDAKTLVMARSNEEWWKWGFTPPPQSTEVHRFALSTEREPYCRYSATGLLSGWAPRLAEFCRHEPYPDKPLRGIDFSPIDVSGDHVYIATSDLDLNTRTYFSLEPNQNSSVEIAVLWDNGQGDLARVGYLDGNAEGLFPSLVQFSGSSAFLIGTPPGEHIIVRVLNLADPVQPKIIGDLALPWDLPFLFSVKDDFILAAMREGWLENGTDVLGIRVFETSDTSEPNLLDSESVPLGFSWLDFQAYTFQNGVLAVPSHHDTGGSVSRNSLSILEIDPEGGIQHLGTIDHLGIDSSYGCPGGPAIRRSIVLGDNLFTVSNFGAKLSLVAQPEVTLASVAFSETPVAQADQELYLPVSELNDSAESQEETPDALGHSESISEKQRQRNQ
ncbi:MAG: hypothetical protein GY906_32195 [bacterium]|nr:hypothetical protein [bacterium]